MHLRSLFRPLLPDLLPITREKPIHGLCSIGFILFKMIFYKLFRTLGRHISGCDANRVRTSSALHSIYRISSNTNRDITKDLQIAKIVCSSFAHVNNDNFCTVLFRSSHQTIRRIHHYRRSYDKQSF